MSREQDHLLIPFRFNPNAYSILGISFINGKQVAPEFNKRPDLSPPKGEYKQYPIKRHK